MVKNLAWGWITPPPPITAQTAKGSEMPHYLLVSPYKPEFKSICAGIAGFSAEQNASTIRVQMMNETIPAANYRIAEPDYITAY
jgi:hypothetical protein